MQQGFVDPSNRETCVSPALSMNCEYTLFCDQMTELTLVVTAIAAVGEAELPVQQTELPAVSWSPLVLVVLGLKLSWRRWILVFENEKGRHKGRA
jgi:hypothetical protein